MALRGIDIASHQAGLSIGSVDTDFVIVKATQGTTYTNPYCATWVEDAIALGKCVGVYHYIGGGNANNEIDFFVNSIKNWIGNVMICLDWESYQNSSWRDESYLEACIKRVIEKAGVIPVIYASKEAPFPWDLCKKYNCGTWVAQYANMNKTGWHDTPWNENSYSCTIRQYSSCGNIYGYNGNLDLNKFYGDRDAWKKYCKSSNSVDVSNDVLSLICYIADNNMNGNARKNYLGSRYSEVQDVINHIATAPTITLANEVISGMYGNGDVRKKVLNIVGRYDEVQATVNKLV